MNIKLRTIPLVVATAIFFSMAVPSLAEAKSEIYKNWRGIAIKGYDPVAYHEEGKPVKGSGEYEFKWKDAKWRFASAEHLIAFAGLAPGVQQSDETRRAGRIGGGGTDKHLRHYLIEATIWARDIPRYRDAYQRALRRRGKKIGRLVVARMLARSIYKMLCEQVAFEPSAA